MSTPYENAGQGVKSQVAASAKPQELELSSSHNHNKERGVVYPASNDGENEEDDHSYLENLPEMALQSSVHPNSMGYSADLYGSTPPGFDSLDPEEQDDDDSPINSYEIVVVNQDKSLPIFDSQDSVFVVEDSGDFVDSGIITNDEMVQIQDQYVKDLPERKCASFFSVLDSNCELTTCTILIYIIIAVTFGVLSKLEPLGDNKIHIGYGLGLFIIGVFYCCYFCCFAISARLWGSYQARLRKNGRLPFPRDRVAGQFMNELIHNALNYVPLSIDELKTKLARLYTRYPELYLKISAYHIAEEGKKRRVRTLKAIRKIHITKSVDSSSTLDAFIGALRVLGVHSPLIRLTPTYSLSPQDESTLQAMIEATKKYYQEISLDIVEVEVIYRLKPNALRSSLRCSNASGAGLISGTAQGGEVGQSSGTAKKTVRFVGNHCENDSSLRDERDMKDKYSGRFAENSDEESGDESGQGKKVIGSETLMKTVTLDQEDDQSEHHTLEIGDKDVQIDVNQDLSNTQMQEKNETDEFNTYASYPAAPTAVMESMENNIEDINDETELVYHEDGEIDLDDVEQNEHLQTSVESQSPDKVARSGRGKSKKRPSASRTGTVARNFLQASNAPQRKIRRESSQFSPMDIVMAQEMFEHKQDLSNELWDTVDICTGEFKSCSCTRHWLFFNQLWLWLSIYTLLYLPYILVWRVCNGYYKYNVVKKLTLSRHMQPVIESYKMKVRD